MVETREEKSLGELRVTTKERDLGTSEEDNDCHKKGFVEEGRLDLWSF